MRFGAAAPDSIGDRDAIANHGLPQPAPEKEDRQAASADIVAPSPADKAVS